MGRSALACTLNSTSCRPWGGWSAGAAQRDSTHRSGATEAACAVLRIDDVLWARLEAQIPDDIQAQLDAMGEQDA